MDPEDVCVVLPALDEARTVGAVIDGFREQGFEDILVVDGGSEDDTREIARERGARVRTQSGEGKGQAVREAFEWTEAPYLLMADADGTYRPEDARALLEPLTGGYDHVVGNRFADMEPGAMSRLNRVGNRLINRAFRLVHGEDFGDVLSGYRAFSRDALRELRLSADGFGIETEMSVECVKKDVATAIVPITYRPRPEGSDANLRPFRDGGIILLEVYRRAKTNNPLFYFGSIGALSTLGGLGLAAFVAVEWFVRDVSHNVLAILAAFAVLFGVQLLIFGVFSDMLVSLHEEEMQQLRRLEEE